MFAWILAASLLGNLNVPFLERLEGAKPGDYIVLEANKSITLLAIRSVNRDTLILEEITLPSQEMKKKTGTWAEWVKNHAPGHTSWSMVEIDLKDRQILECYSFSRSAWISFSQQDSLIATLLQLPLKAIESSQRRKVGPPPMEGETDRRPMWNPPLVFDGEKLETALFDAFEATWPQDGTELSGKTVSLYFDHSNRSALPYWIQVDASYGAASVRAIDSGKNLPSPFRTLPRRAPEFVGVPQKTKKGIRLSIKSPKYYKDFELYAVDITTREKQIHPICHTLISADADLFTFEVDAGELSQVLHPDRKYTWLIVPAGHSESYCESLKPFTWTP